jgi:hypothetical protein
LEDEEELYVSVDHPTMIEEYFDNNHDYEDEEDIPPVLRDKFSGIPRNIRMLETFNNPRRKMNWRM